MDKYLGKRLDGRYEIQEIVGIGGMAVVYKAYDIIDKRTVAIKILKEELLENSEFRRRFKNESKAIAVLNHPNIVKVYDVSLGDRFQYIVMEHVDGITLKEYIERQKVIRWKDALLFITQVLRALQHAHDKGIVHRDIKPQNIMLLQDGTIKVADFGIARFSRSNQHTLTDKAIGSVHYISPEQAKGDYTDEKTDIYSVGVILYEMLTGRLPFDAESAVSVAIMQMQNDPVKPRSINLNIPEGLEEITLRAMQKETHLRYQSASEMLHDIELFKENPQIIFDYKNKCYVDSDPTKYVNKEDNPNRNRVNDYDDYEDYDDKKNKGKNKKGDNRSPVVPVLLGIASALLIGIIIIAFYVCGNLFDIGPCAPNDSTAIDCPNLVGLKYNDVINDEKYKDYTITKYPDEYSSEFAAGVIMSQTPEAGRKLKGDHEIKVKVSMGGKTSTLQDFKGMNISTVEDALKNAKLKYEIKEVYSDEYAAGIVVATNPMGGQPVSDNSNILLYVSKGKAPNAIRVGNYVGSKREDAIRAIEGDGLTVGSIRYDYSSTYPEGYVIDQSLTPGTTVNKGNSIALVISSGEYIEPSHDEPSKSSSSDDSGTSKDESSQPSDPSGAQ